MCLQLCEYPTWSFDFCFRASPQYTTDYDRIQPPLLNFILLERMICSHNNTSYSDIARSQGTSKYFNIRSDTSSMPQVRALFRGQPKWYMNHTDDLLLTCLTSNAHWMQNCARHEDLSSCASPR